MTTKSSERVVSLSSFCDLSIFSSQILLFANFSSFYVFVVKMRFLAFLDVKPCSIVPIVALRVSVILFWFFLQKIVFFYLSNKRGKKLKFWYLNKLATAWLKDSPGFEFTVSK